MFERIYIEIGNICNLSCSFCAGTKKPKRQMNKNEFIQICNKIKGLTKFIYLHVMGEPLLHPEIDSFLKIAEKNDLPVCITTNGVLLKNKEKCLLDNSSAIHKISISLHSVEGNNKDISNEYLENAVGFAKKAAINGIYIVFRLWNEDSSEGMGKNSQNILIENFLKREFSNNWQKRPKGYRLEKNIFLEYDGVFTWPSESKAKEKEEGFCYGLSKQIAILSDGTVVPCCLDSNGDIELGNIFNNTLEEILTGEIALSVKEGFSKGKFIMPLCKKCTFARKFKIRNNQI